MKPPRLPCRRSSFEFRSRLVVPRTQDVQYRLRPRFYGGAFRGPFLVLRHDPPCQPAVAVSFIALVAAHRRAMADCAERHSRCSEHWVKVPVWPLARG